MMEGQPQESMPGTQSSALWNLPSSDQAFDHTPPLPNPERIATIVANATKFWGPGDWHIEAGFYFKRTRHGVSCISLAGVWDHNSFSPEDDWNLGITCHGPGVPVHRSVSEDVLDLAIALSLDAAMQKLEYMTNHEEREREEEEMRQQYAENARRGAIVHDRNLNRERNDILQDRLILHLEIFGVAKSL